MTRLPPPRVVRAAEGVRTGLQRLVRRMVPPEVALLELTSGFMATQAVYAAARLRLADVLVNGPRPASEIAAEIGADPDATHRLLRACAALGVFAEDGEGRFGLTPLARTLCSGARDSMLPVVLMIGDPRYQGTWGELTRSVVTGEPVAEAALGKPMWEFLDDDQEFAATFNDAMTRLTVLDWPAVRSAYDFSGFTTIVDVGGGHGQLLALVLEESPDATGVLQERDALVGEAADRLRAAGLADRCRVEAGSFFDTVPSDGDLYLLRRVLHDFDDAQAGAVLRTVRRGMPAGATLVLLESVVPPGNAPHFAKSLDLDMMVFVGGRERTEREWRALLTGAGFRVTRVVPTISTLSLVEAVPEGQS